MIGHNRKSRSGTALADQCAGQGVLDVEQQGRGRAAGSASARGAAGAGAFLASRPSVTPTVTEDVKAPAVPDGAASKAVESTEAVVDDKASDPEATPPAAEAPAPAPSQPVAPARPARRARRDTAPVASRTSPPPPDSRTATAQAPRGGGTAIPAGAPVDSHPGVSRLQRCPPTTRGGRHCRALRTRRTGRTAGAGATTAAAVHRGDRADRLGDRPEDRHLAVE